MLALKLAKKITNISRIVKIVILMNLRGLAGAGGGSLLSLPRGAAGGGTSAMVVSFFAKK